MKKLEEIYWYDTEGVFAIVDYDSKSKVCIKKRDINPEMLIPIGDANSLEANGRTINQVVQTIYESILDNEPDIDIYKKINAYCIGGMLPGRKDEPHYGEVAINFYHMKD